MGQAKQHRKGPPAEYFREGIRGLGFGTADGYTHEQLEKAADLLNTGRGLIRNGAFFVGSDGEMRIVLKGEDCGVFDTPSAPPKNTAIRRVREASS